MSDRGARGEGSITDFPLLLFLAAVTALVGGHSAASGWLGLPILASAHEHWPQLLLLALYLVLLVIAAACFRHLHRLRAPPGWSALRIGRSLLGAAVVLLGVIVAMVFEKWLEGSALHPHDHALRLLVIGLALLFLGSFLFSALRFPHERVHTRWLHRLGPGEDVGAQALIIALSVPRPWLPEGAATEPSFPLRFAAPEDAPVALEGTDLASDIVALDALPRPWNWQQLMRGIQRHRSSVKQVWLIGSEDAPDKGPWSDEDLYGPTGAPWGAGSRHYLDLARRLVQQYCPAPSVEVRAWTDAVDFTDLDAVAGTIKAIIQTRLKGTPHHEILVDVTGGMKTTSIAAAMVTLNADLLIQYVETQGDMRPTVYDVQYERAPGPHGED